MHLKQSCSLTSADVKPELNDLDIQCPGNACSIGLLLSLWWTSMILVISKIDIMKECEILQSYIEIKILSNLKIGVKQC